MQSEGKSSMAARQHRGSVAPKGTVTRVHTHICFQFVVCVSVCQAEKRREADGDEYPTMGEREGSASGARLTWMRNVCLCFGLGCLGTAKNQWNG